MIIGTDGGIIGDRMFPAPINAVSGPVIANGSQIRIAPRAAVEATALPTRLTNKIVDAATALVGHIRGGLGMSPLLLFYYLLV